MPRVFRRYLLAVVLVVLVGSLTSSLPNPYNGLAVLVVAGFLLWATVKLSFCSWARKDAPTAMREELPQTTVVVDRVIVHPLAANEVLPTAQAA